MSAGKEGEGDLTKGSAHLNFPNLFAPLQIGRLRLKNRIVMPSMSTNFADPEKPGFVSGRHKSYYLERAKGGAALIFTEAVNVNPKKPGRRFGLALYDDRFIAGFQELTALIREDDAHCGIQLNHGGRIGAMKVDFEGHSDRSAIQAGQYFAASPLPHPTLGIVAQELGEDQLKEIAGYFSQAAARAVRAGFDVIELHGAHGYLLNEFLSPYTNQRRDRYGGDLEGRSRFPLEVVKRVRESIGSETILSYRLSALEFVQGGLEIGETKAFAKILAQAGVQVIHVSAGLNETLRAMNRVIPPMSFPRGTLVPYAEQIRKEVGIPVIAVQRINTPDLAEEILGKGKADLIATGRGLIADPYWPLKAQTGRTDEIRRCIGCNQGCMERILMENSLTCLYNPEVGYEDEYRRKGRGEKKKRVLIIGSGVAGMEAARVLANRGFPVRLVERKGQIGGTARLGSVLAEKAEFAGILEYYHRQLKKLAVEVESGKEPDLAVLNEKYDAFLIATGSTPNLLEVKGSGPYQVRLAQEVLENPGNTGGEVVVIGGGSVGIEVAEHLTQLGKKVTVLEMLDRICADVGPLNRAHVLDRIEKTTITVMLKTKVLELRADGILLHREGREEMLKPPETVVIAMGGKPCRLSIQVPADRVHYIGDASKVGNAMDAIHGAFQTAWGL